MPLSFDHSTNPNLINVEEMPVTPAIGDVHTFTITATSDVDNSVSASYDVIFTFVDPCTSATITDNSGGVTTQLPNNDYISVAEFTTDFSLDRAGCQMTELEFACNVTPLLPTESVCDIDTLTRTINPASGQETWTIDSTPALVIGEFESMAALLAYLPLGTYTFEVTASLTNFPSVTPVTQTFQMSMTDPCLLTNLSAPTIIPAIDVANPLIL